MNTTNNKIDASSYEPNTPRLFGPAMSRHAFAQLTSPVVWVAGLYAIQCARVKGKMDAMKAGIAGTRRDYSARPAVITRLRTLHHSLQLEKLVVRNGRRFLQDLMTNDGESA